MLRTISFSFGQEPMQHIFSSTASAIFLRYHLKNISAPSHFTGTTVISISNCGVICMVSGINSLSANLCKSCSLKCFLKNVSNSCVVITNLVAYIFRLLPLILQLVYLIYYKQVLSVAHPLVCAQPTACWIFQPLPTHCGCSPSKHICG